jgi:hypothetical protein
MMLKVWMEKVGNGEVHENEFEYGEGPVTLLIGMGDEGVAELETTIMNELTDEPLFGPDEEPLEGQAFLVGLPIDHLEALAQDPPKYDLILHISDLSGEGNYAMTACSSGCEGMWYDGSTQLSPCFEGTEWKMVSSNLQRYTSVGEYRLGLLLIEDGIEEAIGAGEPHGMDQLRNGSVQTKTITSLDEVKGEVRRVNMPHWDGRRWRFHSELVIYTETHRYVYDGAKLDPDDGSKLVTICRAAVPEGADPNRDTAYQLARRYVNGL